MKQSEETSDTKKKKFTWTFDLGTKNNWEDFFGREVWEWFLPVVHPSLMHGDGINFDSITLEYDAPDPDQIIDEELTEAIVDIKSPDEKTVRRKEKLEFVADEEMSIV
eukprot:TRINITY_DN106_c0_g1_i1.p2 TRINITY_DN106_c0_g1~~TRINITY_DN106_c0_g1_i1.p2  ORF type:complete len:108 (+),score=32.04 TRINITY_DN106_c0_g1_i1:974-1297(+)